MKRLTILSLISSKALNVVKADFHLHVSSERQGTMHSWQPFEQNLRYASVPRENIQLKFDALVHQSRPQKVALTEWDYEEG